MKTIKEILTKSNGVLKLAVHNGVFHADDVLCVAMIKNKLKELGLSREVEIIRSRNPETLAQADIVMDVGGGKYDHHSSDNPAQENTSEYISDEEFYACANKLLKKNAEVYKQLAK